MGGAPSRDRGNTIPRDDEDGTGVQFGTQFVVGGQRVLMDPRSLQENGLQPDMAFNQHSMPQSVNRPAPALVQQTTTIRSTIHMRKESIRFQSISPYTPVTSVEVHSGSSTPASGGPPVARDPEDRRDESDVEEDPEQLAAEIESRLLRLSFEVDTSCVCTVSVFVACEELPSPPPNSSTGLGAIPPAPKVRGRSVFSTTLQPGLGQRVGGDWEVEEKGEGEETEGGGPLPQSKEEILADANTILIDFRELVNEEVVADDPQFPLVIELREVPSPALASPKEGDPVVLLPQCERTFCGMVPPSGYPGTWRASVSKQKLTVEGVAFTLSDIYGIAEPAKKKTVEEEAAKVKIETGNPLIDDYDSDDDDDNDCVICLFMPKTTAVLPCRHLSMCIDCANLLRFQSNKCPICRTPVQSLVHFNLSHVSQDDTV